MAKCPKCGKEIDYLKNYASGEDYSTFTYYQEREESSYEHEEFLLDGKVNDYECPECQEVIAKNEKDATKILKG